MKSKRLLVVGYVWPEPNSSAAGQHMMSILHAFLEKGYDITFSSPALRSDHMADLAGLDIKVKTIQLNCDSFNQFIKEFNPHIVLFDRFMMEEQFAWRVSEVCPQAIKILDTEDLHFLRQARHNAHKQSRSVESSDLQSDMAKREIASIYRCDLSLIISKHETNLLQEQFSVPANIMMHLPFMLDIALPAFKPFEQRNGFVCIGNFRHAPNWHAVLQLKQYIWPHIRKQLPHARLHIYGAYPPPKATQLHDKKSGFLIEGWAPDAKAVMANAKVCLAPLRFGAGLKGKLVEAMMCGTPSVTTAVGIEGILDVNNSLQWPGAVENNNEGFIAQAVNLYQSADLWHSKQEKGKDLLGQFDKHILVEDLFSHICAIESDLTQHRAQNFMGQMLQHHQHASTKYMSQWIEAKNR